MNKTNGVHVRVKSFLKNVYVIFEIIWCDLSLAECIEKSRLTIKFDACPCDPNCK